MRKKRFVTISALLVIGVWYVLAIALAVPSESPQGELVSSDEDVVVSQIIDSGTKLIAHARELARDGVYRRDAHAKTHGCLRADFKVNQLDLPYHQGLFAQKKDYKAWIRFSSGNEKLQSDWAPDARGMAIKVLGVPGRKLLDGEEDAQTQDFVMINHPAFFIPTVAEYADFTRFQSGGNQFAYFFQGRPWQWKLRQLSVALGVVGLPLRPLLGTQFHSMAAYKLGTGNYSKYSARPVSCDGRGGVPSGWASFNSNGLGDDLRAALKAGPRFCFDLLLQLQVKGKNMPVEDTTITWNEDESPFVTVARVEIGKQDIAPMMASQFCENLSFTPWHSLPEHEPVGGLNRIRKTVYQQISRFRRCKNGVAFGEPASDGGATFESKACSAYAPVPSESKSDGVQ